MASNIAKQAYLQSKTTEGALQEVASELEGIVSGIQIVGNASKLGGKSLNEIATMEDLSDFGIGVNVNLDAFQSELSNIATQTDEHLESAMPHQITNLKTGKTYRYGYQISADGIPQVISEEVV